MKVFGIGISMKSLGPFWVPFKRFWMEILN